MVDRAENAAGRVARDWRSTRGARYLPARTHSTRRATIIDPMKQAPMTRTALFLIPFLAATYSCSETKSPASDAGFDRNPELAARARPKDVGRNLAAATTEPVASGCTPALWKRVYKPARLQILDECKVVTGVIDELNVEDDGDEHMLLKLDPDR